MVAPHNILGTAEEDLESFSSVDIATHYKWVHVGSNHQANFLPLSLTNLNIYIQYPFIVGLVTLSISPALLVVRILAAEWMAGSFGTSLSSRPWKQVLFPLNSPLTPSSTWKTPSPIDPAYALKNLDQLPPTDLRRPTSGLFYFYDPQLAADNTPIFDIWRLLIHSWGVNP